MSKFRRRLLMLAANLVNSCFGSGYWRLEKLWANKDLWKN